MKKRTFLQAVLAGGTVALVARFPGKNPASPPLGSNASTRLFPQPALTSLEDSLALNPVSVEAEVILVEERVIANDNFKHSERQPDLEQLPDESIDDYLDKIRNFDADFPNDIYLEDEKRPLLMSALRRLARVEGYVGHGNFNLLGFDEMRFFARNYAAIGAFTEQELAFIEEIFFADANDYGFFGEKVTPDLTTSIPLKDVVKITGSGHYLLKGESHNLYKQIRKDVGDELLLTSGIRNVVKQMHLFLDKTRRSEFNLSKASRSLAPPGHSFHCIGDFDVGKTGLGAQNFTQDFSRTEEFKRMVNLGYIDIRYPDDNRFGVRYEPWHVKLA